MMLEVASALGTPTPAARNRSSCTEGENHLVMQLCLSGACAVVRSRRQGGPGTHSASSSEFQFWCSGAIQVAKVAPEHCQH
mmetsp:Transcript_107193/g.284207  ORF Transcript_107193/g.284207 Transcript_107193/m.284207 type:complete len:81 (-) Transcript_107193:152-394(-)